MWVFTLKLPIFSVKHGRSEHHHWILHIRIRLDSKFQPKLTILIFLDQIFPRRLFPVWNRKSEHHHWILHIWISLSAKFLVKVSKTLHWLHKKNYFDQKSENLLPWKILPFSRLCTNVWLKIRKLWGNLKNVSGRKRQFLYLLLK